MNRMFYRYEKYISKKKKSKVKSVLSFLFIIGLLLLLSFKGFV